MAQPDVVVLGDVNPDLVLTGDVRPRFGQAEQLLDSADLVLGGSAGIMAHGLARLGVPTALVAVVGDDAFGEFVRDTLATAGVDTRWIRTDPQRPTGLTVVLSDGDRAILTHPGGIDALAADEVDLDLLRSARHVHAASFFLLPGLAGGLPQLFRVAHDGGASTSLDTNWDPAERWSTAAAALATTDYLLPNTAELLALTGTPAGAGAVDAAAAAVTAGGTSVVLKNGADGGVMWTTDGQVLQSPARRATVLDTTGAGDSFDAGFVSALVEGLGPQACLDRAVDCGGLSTRAAGGTAAQATRADLDALPERPSP